MQSEDGADALLDSIVRAVRQRLDDCGAQHAPDCTQESGEGCLCVLERDTLVYQRAINVGRDTGAAIASHCRGQRIEVPHAPSHGVGPSGELRGRLLVTFLFLRNRKAARSRNPFRDIWIESWAAKSCTHRPRSASERSGRGSLPRGRISLTRVRLSWRWSTMPTPWARWPSGPRRR